MHFLLFLRTMTALGEKWLSTNLIIYVILRPFEGRHEFCISNKCWDVTNAPSSTFSKLTTLQLKCTSLLFY